MITHARARLAVVSWWTWVLIAVAVVTVAVVMFTGTPAAKAHTGGCNPWQAKYPWYLLFIGNTGGFWYLRWLNVSTGYIHWDVCRYLI